MIKVTDNRIIWHCPPFSMFPWAKRLKVRCDALVPPWCLDYCWVRGRGLPLAQRHVADLLLASLAEPVEFLDINGFFPSIDQERMWRCVSDRELRRDLQRFCDKLGCDTGIPEGCHFSPSLANLYLANIDRRWQGRAIRYGDNIACVNADEFTAGLSQIGLLATRRSNFVRVAQP